MAKLQIPIDDNLMKSLKKYALDHDMTLKDLVISSLEKIITNTTITSIVEESKGVHEALTGISNTTNTDNTKTSYPWDNDEDYVDPFADPDPMDERYFYIIRKTYRTVPITEEEGTYVTNGTLGWFVPEGSSKHFDKDNYLIPFRYTDPDGEVVEPTTDQLEQIKVKYRKDITIER